jgi:hypothetical protein
MNYLQLVQQLASDSGTVPADGSSAGITTIVQLTGRKAKLARWIKDAWLAIQIAHPEWGWLWSEFTLSTQVDISKYAFSDCTDSHDSSAIMRFREFIIDRDPEHDSGLTVYDSSIGLSDQGALVWRDFDWFHRTFERGEMQSREAFLRHHRSEQAAALLPGAKLTNYVVTGDYRKSAQILGSPMTPSQSATTITTTSS